MIRVLLVEDEQIVREGIRQLLETDDEIVVVGELDNGAHIREVVETVSPDVALIDLSMPHVDGVEAIRALQHARRHPAIVVLTTFDTEANIVQALRLGVTGFLRKTTSTPALLAAVRAAASGESVLSRSALATLVPADDVNVESRERLASLGERERAIARAVGEGLTNAEISAEFFLSQATVKSYISRLLTRLGLENRVQLARLWWESGLSAEKPDHR